MTGHVYASVLSVSYSETSVSIIKLDAQKMPGKSKQSQFSSLLKLLLCFFAPAVNLVNLPAFTGCSMTNTKACLNEVQ